MSADHEKARKLAEKMEGLIREAYIKRRWTEPGWELLPSNVDLLLPYATALLAAEVALESATERIYAEYCSHSGTQCGADNERCYAAPQYKALRIVRGLLPA